jgi:hypothetical protein
MPTFPLSPLTNLTKIPYGEFPSVRLQGRYFRRGLRAHRLSPIGSAFCAGVHGALGQLRASSFCRSTPGFLAPVRVMLSRSIRTALTPCAPLAGTSRLPRLPECACTPTPIGNTGVDPCFRSLSSIDMSSSETPVSSSLLAPSSLTDDAGLRPLERSRHFQTPLTLRFS